MKRPSPAIDEAIVAKLLAMPSRADWKRTRAWRTTDLSADTRLTIKREKRSYGIGYAYLWYVTHDGEVIAAGEARDDLEHGATFITGTSAVASAWRRRGVYSGVLQALRYLVGAPIESDVSLTSGALGAWRKAGGKLDERNGDRVYRINPTRR